MKKAWIFLIVLALVAFTMPVFADGPTAKANVNLQIYGNIDSNLTPTTALAGFDRLWPSLDVAFDKNNDFVLNFRASPGSMASFTGNRVEVHGAKWVSNLTASAGFDLPVSVTLTAGWFEADFTNWWFAETNAYEFYYGGARFAGVNNANWPNMLITSNVGSAIGGFQFDVNAGMVNFHWYEQVALQDTLLGVDASFAGFGVYVAYGVYGDGNALYPKQDGSAGKGDLSIEAKYDVPKMGDLSISVYPFFRYGLSDSKYTYGGSVGVGYTMFHVAAGLQGDDGKSLNHISAEVWVNPIDAARIFVGAYFNNYSNNALQAVDINASYKFGGYVNLLVGYIVGGTDKLAIPIVSDNGVALANGPYFGVSVNF